MEVHRGEHGRRREHDHGKGHESPFDTLASAIGGIKQCSRAFGEEHDERP